jgi:putative SOS response-associated peptidase YedK
MCGRYVTPDEAAMERAYNLTARQWQAWMGEAYRPSYNVAPSQRVPVLRVIRQVGGERRMDPMRWGLIPFFARGEPPKYSTIHAMIEKLDVAPAWRGPWRRSQRCIMPAAGEKPDQPALRPTRWHSWQTPPAITPALILHPH